MVEGIKGTGIKFKFTKTDGTVLESEEFIIPNGAQGAQGDQGVGVASMELVYSGTAPSPTRFEIGDLFFSSSSTSPAIRFGGTWTQIKDRFILAAGDTYAAGTTGGEATHKLTEAEMPIHNHNLGVTSAGNFGTSRLCSSDGAGLNMEPNPATATAGSSQPHNNMPPYHVAYVWRKISN